MSSIVGLFISPPPVPIFYKANLNTAPRSSLHKMWLQVDDGHRPDGTVCKPLILI